MPMESFNVPVKNTDEAILIMETLANYDIFQYENGIKPDYCNAGGLNVFENGEWIEWENENGEQIDDLRREAEETDKTQ